MEPTIIEARPDMPIIQEETFAPILYTMPYSTLEDAIAIHNSVPQGLSSAIFTTDLLEAEQFLSAQGSDCGLVSVNTGTAGAEIGGAFGGEKETGGGAGIGKRRLEELCAPPDGVHQLRARPALGPRCEFRGGLIRKTGAVTNQGAGSGRFSLRPMPVQWSHRYGDKRTEHVLVEELEQVLDTLAPFATAEPWDNVGLLVGRRGVEVRKVLVART